MPSDVEREGEVTLVFRRGTGFLQLVGNICMLLGATPGVLDLVGVDISRRLGRVAWIVLVVGLALYAIAVGLAYREGRRDQSQRR